MDGRLLSTVDSGRLPIFWSTANGRQSTANSSGEKKNISPRSTDHGPQQIEVNSNFGFHFGINFDKGLQIAVDSQLWTVDKKKPSIIIGQKKSPRSSEI